MTVPHLDLVLKLRGDGLEFDEEDVAENRSSRKYLFYAKHSTRCYGESDWGKLVKATFKKWSPRGVETPPKLLRRCGMLTMLC